MPLSNYNSYKPKKLKAKKLKDYPIMRLVDGNYVLMYDITIVNTNKLK